MRTGGSETVLWMHLPWKEALQYFANGRRFQFLVFVCISQRSRQRTGYFSGRSLARVGARSQQPLHPCRGWSYAIDSRRVVHCANHAKAASGLSPLCRHSFILLGRVVYGILARHNAPRRAFFLLLEEISWSYTVVHTEYMTCITGVELLVWFT